MLKPHEVTKPTIFVMVQSGDYDVQAGSAGHLTLRGQQEMHFVADALATKFEGKKFEMHSSPITRCVETAYIMRGYIHVGFVQHTFMDGRPEHGGGYSNMIKSRALSLIENTDCDVLIFVCHEHFLECFPIDLASIYRVNSAHIPAGIVLATIVDTESKTLDFVCMPKEPLQTAHT